MGEKLSTFSSVLAVLNGIVSLVIAIVTFSQKQQDRRKEKRKRNTPKAKCKR